jgi:hypothetical protein
MRSTKPAGVVCRRMSSSPPPSLILHIQTPLTSTLDPSKHPPRQDNAHWPAISDPTRPLHDLPLHLALYPASWVLLTSRSASWTHPVTARKRCQRWGSGGSGFAATKNSRANCRNLKKMTVLWLVSPMDGNHRYDQKCGEALGRFPTIGFTVVRSPGPLFGHFRPTA